MAKWDKEELIKLYVTEGKTLEEIGKLKGVSRERIRQVMEGFEIKREHLDTKGICQVCGGLGYREYEAGLIRLPCRACNVKVPA